MPVSRELVSGNRSRSLKKSVTLAATCCVIHRNAPESLAPRCGTAHAKNTRARGDTAVDSRRMAG